MKKIIIEEKSKETLKLLGAAIGGAVATMLHLEFIIALIIVIIVANLDFKKSKLNEKAIKVLKALVIAIIIVLSLVYHFTFCNRKQENNNNNVEVVIEDDTNTEEENVEEDQSVEEAKEENESAVRI